MLKKLLLGFLILVLFSSVVLAVEAKPKQFDQDVPFGKSIEINFNGFGEYTLLIREGSIIFFNLGDVKNTFIIDQINENEIIGRLSLVGGSFEDFKLPLDLKTETQLNLTDEIPFMLMQYQQFSPSEDIKEKRAIVKIRSPFAGTDFKASPINIQITNQSAAQIEDQDSDWTFKILLIVIIILLILIIFLGPKQFKKKSK